MTKDIESKKPHRKGKREWRKNIDISKVDDNLQVLRNEARVIGDMSKASSEDLFVIDKKGDHNLNNKKSKKLRVDENITPKSKIDVPHRKKANKKTPSKKLKPSLLSKAGAVQNDNNSNNEQKAQKNEQASEIWNDDDQSMNNNTKENKKKSPSHVHKPSQMSATGHIHPGSSYNPSFSDHQDALKEAIKIEERRSLNEKIVTTNPPENLSIATGESANDNSGEDQQKTTDASLPAPDFIPTPNEKKEKKKKDNKVRLPGKKLRAAEAKRRAREQRQLKTLRKATDQFNHLKSIKQEIKTKEQIRRQKFLEKKIRRKEQDIERTRKLGRKLFKQAMFPVKLTENLSDSLRTLVPEGNPVTDRFKNLQQRNMIEVTEPGTKKKKKEKKVEKHSHKDANVLTSS